MTGELLVMGSTGHTTVEWDTEKSETVDHVKAEFDRIVGYYGGFAFVETESGEREQIRKGEFDPETQTKVVIAPGMQGGC